MVTKHDYDIDSVWTFLYLLSNTCELPFIGWLVVCLLFNVQLKNLYLIWTSPNADEGLQILTYTRHLRPLSSGGSFMCRHRLWHGTSSFTISSEWQETYLKPVRLELATSRSRFYISWNLWMFGSSMLKYILIIVWYPPINILFYFLIWRHQQIKMKCYTCWGQC